MFFLINESLEECDIARVKKEKRQYVALLTSEEWLRDRETFDMGIDLEPDVSEIHASYAEENYDSITGAFCIPNRSDFWLEAKFAFALDEKGIVLIDDSGIAARMIENIRRTKKWRFPSLERFLYDFLEQTIKDDLRLMEKYERELNDMETAMINNDENEEIAENRVNDIRSDIRDLSIHYEQLLDMGEVFEENESGFFTAENLRYFRLFSNRIERLRDRCASVRDYAMQVRDLYNSHIDTKQNNIMTVLTVVTTIFMPLTLITGWFGMNFKYMPELEKAYAYPAVIIISLIIVIASLIFFKKKKWL